MRAVLLAAGIFQLSPAKNACLAHCRSPTGHAFAETPVVQRLNLFRRQHNLEAFASCQVAHVLRPKPKDKLDTYSLVVKYQEYRQNEQLPEQVP